MPMKFILSIVCLLTIYSAFGNTENAELPQGKQTLQEQYVGLKSEQEVIDGYRMVKLYVMDQFWKTVQDSLQAQRASMRASVLLSASQAKEIESLKASLAKVEKSKEELIVGVDNIVVMGKAYPKAGFITVVSFVILGLVVLSVLLFVASRASLITTRELRKLNETMYNEFEVYKHQAVEKQIKLSRELQDYRNRMADLRTS
jgi:hypothetical protein